MVDKFRFRFGSAENKITFSSPVSFSAEKVYTGFGRSLVARPRFSGRRSVSTVLSRDCLGRPGIRLQSAGVSAMQGRHPLGGWLHSMSALGQRGFLASLSDVTDKDDFLIIRNDDTIAATVTRRKFASRSTVMGNQLIKR